VALGIGVLTLTLGVTSCSGTDSASTTSTTATSVPVTTPPVTVAAYCDPAVPISVALGQQFAIVLDADPASGSSWQTVAPPDPNVVLSIGTEFPGPDQVVAGSICTQASQVLRYGGKGLGSATITLRYGRPGAAATPEDKTLVFTVTVVDPSAPTTTTAPPAPPTTTTTPAAPTTTTRRTTTTTSPKRTTTTTGRTTTTT
jgi:predicted secreted protein